jgi:hypothetical protein
MKHLPRRPRCQFVFVASGPPCAAARGCQKATSPEKRRRLAKKEEGMFLATLKECSCLSKSVNTRAEKVRRIHGHHHHVIDPPSSTDFPTDSH